MKKEKGKKGSKGYFMMEMEQVRSKWLSKFGEQKKKKKYGTIALVRIK